eukprot:GHVS01048438.1.p1 GENE.GHVS01048438.1~~GHVS01048438.1.p1  ORF type:complete len:127 (+),score=28.21 GHVS01048438.1:1-381(+)
MHADEGRHTRAAFIAGLRALCEAMSTPCDLPLESTPLPSEAVPSSRRSSPDMSQLLARTVQRQEERRKSMQKEHQKTVEALAACQAEVAVCREELRRLREAASSYLYKQNAGWDDGLFRRLPPDVY